MNICHELALVISMPQCSALPNGLVLCMSEIRRYLNSLPSSCFMLLQRWDKMLVNFFRFDDNLPFFFLERNHQKWSQAWHLIIKNISLQMMMIWALSSQCCCSSSWSSHLKFYVSSWAIEDMRSHVAYGRQGQGQMRGYWSIPIFLQYLCNTPTFKFHNCSVWSERREVLMPFSFQCQFKRLRCVWYDCTANKTCVMFLFNRNSQKIDFDRLTGFSHACIGKFMLN